MRTQFVSRGRDLLGVWARRFDPRRPRGRRSVAVLALAWGLICIWQAGFRPHVLPADDLEITSKYAVTASTGVHGEPHFFFFLYRLGLYPLSTQHPLLVDTDAEASRQLAE